MTKVRTVLKTGHLEGQSADAKPLKLAGAALPAGTIYYELDTDKYYTFDGSTWQFSHWGEEGKAFASQQPRSSLITLFGDTFGTTAASAIYLLENEKEKSGGTGLENNGAIQFAVDGDLPLRGYKVPTLDGNQYLSVPTETANQVGIGSFVVSIQFKTTIGTTQNLIGYGDDAASEQNWSINYNTTDRLRCMIDDGTNAATVTNLNGNQYNDNKWHTATMVVDRDPAVDLMYLYVDGVELDRADISAVTLTLDNVGTSVFIGARNNGGSQRGFTGQLSNAQIYIADAADDTVKPDYNLPALTHAGIRESAFGAGGSTLAAQSASRIANINTSTGQGNYMTAVINTSEGIYEMINIHRTNVDSGYADYLIDGIPYLTGENQYAGVAASNTKSSANGIHLSAGTHILKILQTGVKDNSSSNYTLRSQMLELIKRGGDYNESDEATSGNFFFDELSQRTTGGDFQHAIDTAVIYNSSWFNGDQADLDDFEGDVYLKKGLYKVTLSYKTQSNKGILDLYMGGVKVFDQFDMYTAGAVVNNLTTHFAFLEGGKTTVRGIVNGKNGSSSAYSCVLYNLRVELVSGKGNGDTQMIFPTDNDIELVAGTAPTVGISTSRRFNMRLLATDADSEHYVVRRYFSGGTYEGYFMYSTHTDRPIIDIYSDDNSASIDIIDGLDMYVASGSSQNNKRAFSVTLSRGWHDIHFLTNGKNGSSSGYAWNMNQMQFTKTGSYTNKLDDNSDGVHGSLVPLAYHEFRADSTTVILSLGGVSAFKFHEVIIDIVGTTTATAAAELRIGIDDNDNNVYQDGARITAGAETLINIGTATYAVLLDTTILTASTKFGAKLRLKLTGGVTRSVVEGDVQGSSIIGDYRTSYSNNSALDPAGRLNVITLTLSAGEINNSSLIDVKGVLR